MVMIDHRPDKWKNIIWGIYQKNGMRLLTNAKGSTLMKNFPLFCHVYNLSGSSQITGSQNLSQGIRTFEPRFMTMDLNPLGLSRGFLRLLSTKSMTIVYEKSRAKLVSETSSTLARKRFPLVNYQTKLAILQIISVRDKTAVGTSFFNLNEDPLFQEHRKEEGTSKDLRLKSVVI